MDANGPLVETERPVAALSGRAFEGHIAVITGGSSGIGRATALAFAREGARIVVGDLNEVGGRETLDAVAALGADAEFVRCDVTDPGDVARLVARAVERFGAVHAMINNAGIGTYTPLLDHTPDQFDRVVKVNQYGVFYGMVAAGRAMRELQIAGTIVNTSSVYGFLGSEGIIGYHASKGAVGAMTQAAALELAPYGIRVIAVAPGIVDTPIIAGYKARGDDSLARGAMRGKLLQPEAVAATIVWLCSPGADAINGSTVLCDDGFASFKV